MPNPNHGSPRPSLERYWRFAREFVMGPAFGHPGECCRRALGEDPPNTRRHHELARKWLQLDRVQTLIVEARAELQERGGMTVEQHLERLRDLQEQAVAAGDFKAAARCQELAGRAMGYDKQVHMHTIDDHPQSAAELAREIAGLVRDDPRLAAIMREELDALPCLQSPHPARKQIESRSSVPVEPAEPATLGHGRAWAGQRRREPVPVETDQAALYEPPPPPRQTRTEDYDPSI